MHHFTLEIERLLIGRPVSAMKQPKHVSIRLFFYSHCPRYEVPQHRGADPRVELQPCRELGSALHKMTQAMPPPLALLAGAAVLH